MAIYLRVTRLIDLGELLPAETEAFWAVNMDAYKAGPQGFPNQVDTDLFGTPLSDLTWFDRDQGYASINGNKIRLLKVNSVGQAQVFLNSLRAEGEEFTVIQTDRRDPFLAQAPEILCYSVSFPTCFSFVDSVLIISISKEALSSIQAVRSGAPDLETVADYQNMQGRLSPMNDAFVYLNLQKLQTRLTLKAREMGLPSLAFASSIFQIFPSFGASIRMEPRAWFVESFTGVDKTKLGGDAYFRPTKKFEQKSLPWTESFVFEWAGEDLAAQLKRLGEIFTQLNWAAGLSFESELKSAFTDFVGPAELTDLYQLLDGEVYFGVTQGETPRFLSFVELTTPDAWNVAMKWKDNFEKTYRAAREYQTSSGEWKAELSPIVQSAEYYQDIPVFKFSATHGSQNGATVLLLGMTDNWLVLASDDDTLHGAVERMLTGENQRSLSDLAVLLPGSDEITILRTVWTPFTRIALTRKLFDDGVFARLSLLLD